MRDKEAVEADLYVEDSPDNILRLVDERRRIIVYGNSTNAAELPDSDCILQGSKIGRRQKI